ncbi:MAG: hypothetical protein HC779_00715, partial [Phyllobacteriaceae bacterium]|nr:hypothetical protein [Phyllobacteriaceae bacterium]
KCDLWFSGSSDVLAYFGEISSNPDPSTDSLYLMTSSYRPPLAALFLARKQFPRPLELHASKPLYQIGSPATIASRAIGKRRFLGKLTKWAVSRLLSPMVMSRNMRRWFEHLPRKARWRVIALI